MSSPEKLAKIIEQLKTIEISDDTNSKKKELKVLLQTLVEHNCSSHLQTHKEFATYIGPSIDVLLKHYDSRESDIRLASDEGLCRIIKALVPIHSNRVLVELCRQIKRNSSSRVLKLAMTRFADLCHHARPQKQRAYLANLLNAISNIATRKEEILHESLAHFIQKVFSVMGIFAFENESKNFLKIFLQNLESESATIRRSAAISIATIISTNRKSEMLLFLVTEYLIDQILLSEEKAPKTAVIIGTLIALKMILPLYSTYFPDLKANQRCPEMKTSSSQSIGCTMERIVQIFELCVHYSAHPSDHNVLNAALELLLQLLRMRGLILAIPALKNVHERLGTHISSTGLLKINSQWNVSPIPVAEESNLIEPEVALKTLDESNVTDIPDEIGEIASELDASLAMDKSVHNSTRIMQDSASTNENEELECSSGLNESEEAEQILLPSTQEKETEMDTLKSTRGYSPIMNAARHLCYHFLITAKNSELKPDMTVRVSTKCLALNCLTLLGSVEPNVWNIVLDTGGSIRHSGMLLYETHDDPQIRGQISLMACAILQCAFSGFELRPDSVITLLQIVEAIVKDRETAACRLALQGLRMLLPVALESPYSFNVAPLLQTLLDLSNNSYWLVKVDLIEVFSSLPWSALKYAFNGGTTFNAQMFERDFIRNVLLRLVGDEDHRVRNAIADSIPMLISSWTTVEDSPAIAKVRGIVRDPNPHLRPSFGNVLLNINSLAEAYKDSECNTSYISSLQYFVKLLFEEMAMSRSKFAKMGCIQSLSALSSAHRPAEYLVPYGCELDGSCDLLRTAVDLMTCSPLMLDLGTHQALLALAGQLFAGCVKASIIEENENISKDWLFLSSNLSTVASDMLCHISRILNGFCCIIEDMNPLSQVPKTPLVTLPNPSSLSPIRRKSKSTDPSAGGEKDEKADKEELGRKWNKPSQLLSQQNLGHFASSPLYVKLYEHLKATYSTCKLTFDAVTSDRLSNFIKAVLDVLGILLEVGTFHDVGKHSDELLNYLRWIITIEPVPCLYSVQQLLKSLFGANLASAWLEQSVRIRRAHPQTRIVDKPENFNLYQAFGLDSDSFKLNALRKNSPRLQERANHVMKFRTTVGKLGADKTALSAHIRLFEPMVIKALKLYTITSSAAVQKQVLDLLCELIHFCVNYCMLDAEQVFLNFVIQQFEFLEEGFIPDVEILLPSMFRFLSLLSYDRFHSKTIISVPRIMQLSGGLMAAGKDTQCYVLPTLEPMVEDLFLSRERMNDNSKELETQREVLINILLKMVQYHQVFPLLSAVLMQVHTENVAKWRLLSKQICDVLIPQLYAHALNLDSIDALAALQKLFSHLDPPVVHESLLGLLQVFASSQTEDFDGNTKYHRVLACRLIVLEILAALFDEAFLLDCLNEFNLTYLVDRRSDPLNVTPTENFSAERILSSLMVATVKMAIVSWKRKVDQNRILPSWISWETDESFDVHLVLQLADLMRRIIHSGDFPVLKIAIMSELLGEEKHSSLIKLCADLISNNPVVFVKICALYPNEAKNFRASHAQFAGFSGFIAKNGYFLIICEELESKELQNSMEIFADQILLLFEEPPVGKLLTKVFNDISLSETLLDYILKKPGENKARNMYRLLLAFERYQLGQRIGIEVFELVVRKIAELNYSLVHCVLKRIVRQRLESERNIQLTNSCKNCIESAPAYRFYTDLFSELSPSVYNVESFPVVDKTFFLDCAFKRNGKKLNWKRVLALLDQSNFQKLFTHELCLRDILLGSCKLFPELFHVALSNFFHEVQQGDSSSLPASEAAQTIVHLLNDLPFVDMSATFSLYEIVELCKLPLVFLSSMGSTQENVVLLYASSKIICRFESDISQEWRKKENSELLQKSIETVESFLVCLRNGKPLIHHECLDVSSNHAGENLIKHARSLSRMVTFIEREKATISESLLGYIRVVLVAFCRLPLFYSHVCIPPSVWSREWTPQVKVDMETLTLDLPVVPSAYLHDEIIFEQFLFRIELIGWTNRQKFEEIWMTLLGIINLQNEEEFRPEEQASIILATCKAIRAVTMIIQKNLALLSSSMKPKNDSKRIMDYMQSERGKKLSCLLELLPLDASNPKANYLSHKSYHRQVFNAIEKNLAMGSPSKKQSTTPDNLAHVDVHSCVYFLKDLYSQWLQSPDTGCALLTEVLRSLYEISNFFTDVSSFEWMFECTTNILKFVQPDDPQSLESALAKCIIKSAAFIHLNADSWELVRKHCEFSLNSQYIKTRASVLESLPYLLQRLTFNPDQTRATSLVNLIMDYTSKYLGTEKPGPEWHQSWLWTLSFYCGEHFPDMPFRSYMVIDFVVQCALNGLLENNFQSVGLHQQILQGIERLCLLGVASLNKRKLIKMEVVNLIRNFDRESVLLYALRALLALVYSDFTSQLYKPGVDPETMLVAMEWVGSLFHRMKRGTDNDANIIGRVMPYITSDMFSPADILNRVLSEFISARPAVACCLTPTIFKVFAAAREHDQQSLVSEWILFSLTNFTKAAPGTEAIAVWNILCFFTAASQNPWLQAIFPSVSRPMNANDAAEVQIFIASALEFRSQLSPKHQSILTSTFNSVKSRSPFFAAAGAALDKCESN